METTPDPPKTMTRRGVTFDVRYCPEEDGYYLESRAVPRSQVETTTAELRETLEAGAIRWEVN